EFKRLVKGGMDPAEATSKAMKHARDNGEIGKLKITTADQRYDQSIADLIGLLEEDPEAAGLTGYVGRAKEFAEGKGWKTPTEEQKNIATRVKTLSDIIV